MSARGRVSDVQPGSPADAAGISAGDCLVSINGSPIRDIIDYRFHAADPLPDVVVKRGDELLEYEIEKEIDDPLGLEFDEELFDGTKTCDNCCIFCFVHQLPRGMRRSLYIRDDDYRLSFLHGNFITLASEGDDDIRRIIEQRLSPLYISVHTTDEALRREMLCHPAAPEIMPRLARLAEGNITLHTQIVLCPGRNDGEQLDRTITDLASLYPAVDSIAVVPVGLTKHRRKKELVEAVTQDDAAAAVGQIRRWQRRLLKSTGRRLVYASDEMYLSTGLPIPGARTYEGYPQLENGVGIVRRFIDGAARVARRFPESLSRPVRASIVTGVLAAPILERFAKELSRTRGLELKVESIENEFFGDMVTVTGLLTGRDVISQLKERDLLDVVVLPAVFTRDGLFLDDVPIERVEEELGVPVQVVDPSPGALAARILEMGLT